MGKALISKQILSTNSLWNAWRSVWRICVWIFGLKGLCANRPFSHDVTSAILVSQNSDTAAMLVFETSLWELNLLLI